MSRRERERDREPQPVQTVRWIGGTHAVEETLNARPRSVRELWIEHENNNPAIKRSIALARAAGVRVNFVSKSELDKVAGGRHQGLAVKVSVTGYGENLNDFLKQLTLDAKSDLVLVALDEIQDPHNLGAIARSAANFGAKGVIVTEHRAAPVSQTAVKASAGAIQKIAVFRVVNLAQSLERCKEHGIWVYGADMNGAPAWRASLNRPMVLVIGSEGKGLRPLVRETCDEIVSIPQSAGGVESLNASCAASVLLYEAARQAQSGS